MNLIGYSMRRELKKAIIDWLYENHKDFSRVNSCTSAFSAYIFDSHGEYLIGGEDVANFIRAADKLINSDYNL